MWVLPEKDFEKQLNKNVINRYSNSNGVLTIAFDSHSKIELFSFDKKVKEKALLFIKSPFLNNGSSRVNIELYLQKLCEFIKQKYIKKYGYLVIQTQDVRINGYIEPMAKKLVEMISGFDNLWLKEIIIITQNGIDSGFQNSGKHLKISHQYLLVYEVIQ